MNRWRPIAWGVVSVACFIGAIYFWRLGDKWQAQKPAPAATTASNAPSTQANPPGQPARFESTFIKSSSTAPVVNLNPAATNAVVTKGSNAFPYRLSNTTKTVGQLTHDSHAILLENALIDSSSSTALSIPDSLKSHGDPGAYLVQSSGPMNQFKHDQIVAAGGTVISYFPNNTYLVTGTSDVAARLGQMFSVQPWEPYYKVKASLMPAALSGQGISAANVAVFPAALEQTKAALDKMGATVLSESPSPFGTQLALRNVANIANLAGLPGIEIVEPSLARIPANDLTRVIMSDSVDVFVPTNYLGLSGSNVLVSVPDSWVATNGTTVFNPDLPGTTVIGYSNAFPFGFADLEGHATHVGGIIAGSGLHSPTNAVGSQVGADFRGKAPLSKLFALPLFDPFFTDAQLQQTTARTNALISNNSWGYGTSDYNLAAASYDQAVRDSLPGMTGSQGLIYVFAAGNSGGGADDGQGGFPDSLTSPAVAKNVISVGASELPRNITNDVWTTSGCGTNTIYSTNKPWAGETDSQNEVAAFSSRGNVGIGLEGDFGRFKPDVVAPGVFVVSTRSMTWDTNAYYNITNHNVHTFFGDTVQTNALFNYLLFVDCGAVELDLFTTSVNPLNVNLPIFARNGAKPTFTVYDDVGTNVLQIPNIAVNTTWFYSVGNDVTNVPVQYNITSDLITTNGMGDYWDVLRTNLNEQLFSSNSPTPLYRYESGTSMAAPAVAGTLALMEDFFTNQVHYTPSPALMKAMLINGARSINPSKYDFQVQSTINYQGWGLVNLTNSLPIGVTNGIVGASGPMLYQDQDPTNALATGDSRTIFVSVDPNAQNDLLRVTLVWTDPPGNPAAGVKLVNDLDLVVTNLDTINDPAQIPLIYYGNDIAIGNISNLPWDTNFPPNIDNINNVENVYITPSTGTNYSITVRARAVNVNAITAHTNGIVQDYALVISSGNGAVTNALKLSTINPVAADNYAANLTVVTNQFAAASDVAGGVLLGQHVGASSPLQGTNTLSLGSVVQDDWGNNGQITLGVSNQWHFYVITNAQGTNATSSFTNAVFATFLPPTLSITPGGVNGTDPDGATRPEADIDLYVARGPNAWALTNLDPTVVAASDKSLSRGGTETVTYTDAKPNEVFYIGVKSEDQEAAEYAFVGLFALEPFSSLGDDGTVNVRGINVPTPIPDGSAGTPGEAMTIGVDVMPITIRRAVVTNVMEHENFGDLFGILKHGQKTSVLNNHSFGNGNFVQQFVYEDNDEHDIPGSQHTDFPGTLKNFTGEQGIGLWVLTELDNAASHTGQVDRINIRLDPQQGTNGVVATIQPNSFFYDFIDVPPAATNMTVCVNFISGTGPVQLYLRYGDYPTQTSYDYTKLINAPGDCLTVSRVDLPPLKPGRYYVGVYNPNATPQTIRLTWTFGLDPNGVTPTAITPTNPSMALPDDALTNNTIFISNNQNIVTVNVGVVLQHPRVSDLDLTLIAPTGQRILLFENRGGISATNMGHLNVFTNFFGATSAGDANQNNNQIGPVPPSGILIIDYDFFQIADRMDVYDGSLNIFSSGSISGAGTFTIPYNLVNGNLITIVMNQGNNVDPNTLWTYTPRVVTQDYTYLTFTDDTNVTDMPIKFAIPPYDGTDNGTNFTLNDFELNTNGEYIITGSGTKIIPDGFGGWAMTTNDVFVRTNYFGDTNLLSMSTNQVSIVTDPRSANNGSNYLALARGSISRTISLIPAKDYDITYRYRGPGIAGWWRGEGNATDSAGPENLGNNGSLIGRFNFPAGEVDQAFAMEDPGLPFQFAGTNTYVQIPQSFSLDVGRGSGFTVEGWINPTNITFQQPMVEWLATVPTNPIVNGRAFSNLVVLAGPFLNRETSHYYYLLGQTNWATSELWANSLGGHLVEVDDANEQNWVYETFAQFAGSNYVMWTGLTNGTAPNTNFVWSTGNSNVVYTNWAFGEPTNCPTAHFTAILSAINGLPGNWTLLDNNGLKCGGAPGYSPFGIAEVNEIRTNGVQFWISVTNAANPGNGRLYANIFDTNGAPHEIFSPAGLIQSNVFQHVALTYDTNNGVANLYYNGTNVASTNLGIFVPKTAGDVLIGKDMSRATNNFFWGRMDEMSIYSRFLSPSEIRAIYQMSASTTNRHIGKFDPAITPSQSLGEAQVSFGGITNLIYGNNNNWQVQGFSLKALSNSLPVQLTGIEPGVLLDSFSVFQKPPGNLYYFPEQPLQALMGSNALGNWTLEIRDARTGAVSTNAELISWQLQFILQTNIAPPIQLTPQAPGTNTVPPGQIAYFSVFVPSWANNATNILVSATAPVDLLFNQTTPPGTGAPGDFTFLTGATTGNQMISSVPPSTPPLVKGQTYYLGVKNNGAVPSTVVVRVDFNMTTLTNGVTFTSTLGTNDLERPFLFNVSSNATEATFELLKVTGNADLVLRKGLPLPTLTDADYGSFSGSNADETIYVLTNSLPVPLSEGPWYLDVVKRSLVNNPNGSNAVTYTVLAKQLTNAPTIITLSNRVPLNYTAGPGTALTNFFKFSVTNFPLATVTNLGLRFELFNQSGNGDLTVQTNRMPLAPSFLQSSRLPFNNAEIIFIRTNISSTTNLNADWYLGVPNNETNPISFTILAELETNSFAAFPTAEGSGAYTRGGALTTNVYHVTTMADAGPGSLRYGLNILTNGGTIVFDRFGTNVLSTPLIVTNSNITIAGQTAPGNGITIVGPTYLQGAHDVILRYLRFRSVGGAAPYSLQLTNTANIIADHISTAFGTNVVGVLNSSNVTVQWSVIGEGTSTNDISTGGSEVRFGSGDVTFHHNLYADNFSGNPTIGEDVSLDFENNVIFNWGLFSGFSTNDLANNPGGLTNFLNYSANYLIAGSNTVFTNVAFWGGTPDTWIFQTNNFIDTNKNSILDGANTSWGMFSNQFTPFSHAFDIPPPTAPDEAFIAYERVLDFAGTALEKRDIFDRGIAQRVRLQPVTNAPAMLSGMSAWWKAENNANDSIGANNGVFNGTVSYVTGEVTNAFNFNGASYVQVPDGPGLRFTNVMSGDAWIKLTNYSGFNEVFSKYDTGPNNSYTLGIDPSTHKAYFECNAANNNSIVVTVFAGLAVPLNTWTHLAVVVDGTAAKIYMNGILSGSQPWALGIYPGITPLSIGCTLNSSPTSFFKGQIDEVSLYKRALSDCEIAAIYNSGTNGKTPILVAATNGPAIDPFPFADIDRDGIPDFWEISLLENPTNFSPNLDRDGDGYTDLEEYMNWLGAPHALTVTNQSTNVDLYVLSGNTGNLRFGVANGTNGTVYLTNSNPCAVAGNGNIAVFTPTNDFGGGTNYGFGSFTYMVTNLDTTAYIGPITVSVFVSAVPITNAGLSTNIITFTNSLTNQMTFEMMPYNFTNGAIDSDPAALLTYTISTIIDTNATLAHGWPLTNLTLVPSPTIDPNTGAISWVSPTEAQGPGVYTITTVATDNGLPPAHATNIITLTVNESNRPPVFVGTPPNQTNSALTTFTISDPATDPDIPYNPLTYMVLNPPAGMTEDPLTGIITWTPTLAQFGTFIITNVVTDTNAYDILGRNQLSATNYFTLVVNPAIMPYVFTQPAQAVTGASAKLNGMATPNGLPAVAWFEWGTNTLYGNQTAPVVIGNGYNVVYATAVISSLSSNVPYHYRLVSSNVVGIAYGFDQIFDEANVIAWGADYVKQVEVPPGLSNVVAIAGAYDHSLALKNNETVVAWGDNTFTQTNVPAGLNNILAVAGGQYSSMALRSTGTVAAWGGNILSVTNVPPGLNNVIMIAGGTYASLALRNNGSVVSWGANFFNLTNLPAGLNNVVEVAGGSYHSLAIRNDGTVVAWGDNSAGQTNVPPGLTNVVAIAGGNYHSLALRSDGTVVSWGDNSSGQTNVPPGLTNVVAVAAGGFHSLALKSDGTVIGWGDNTAGQARIPVGLSNVVAISSGYFHSLALTPTLPPTNAVLDITNGLPQTNSVLAGSIVFYRVQVPVDADAATNSLLFALNGPLNMWYTTNVPPTISLPVDFELLTNVFTGTSVVSTATSPQLMAGKTYYLGLQNTNTFSVSYVVEVDFHLVPITPLTNGVPATNAIPSGGLTFYQVDVPTNADFATNLLFSGTGPLDIWFSTNVPPTITNADDFLLIGNAPSGSATLSTNGTPQLVPGTTYYLGVHNNGASSVTYGIGVNFHFPGTTTPPLTNTIPISTITQTNINGTNGFLLVWFAPTNALFQVQWSPGLLQPWNTFTNIIGFHTFISPTNSEFEFFDDGSQTGGLGFGRIYRLILLNPGSIVPVLPGGSPVTNTVAPGTVAFYQVNTPNNANYATNSLLSATLPVNMWLTTNVPPTITNATDLLVIPNATSGAYTTVAGSVFPSFVPGSTYYIGVENTNTSAVTVALQVDFHLFTTPPSTNPIPISTITQTNGGFLLVWFAPASDLFQVQWSSGLFQPWSTFTNIISYHQFISATNSEFEFFDDGSQTGGFGLGRVYRLLLLNTNASTPTILPLTNSVPASNSVTAGAVTYYQVSVPTNADYGTNLLLSGTGPLNVWFSTNNPPTVGGGNDFDLIPSATSGSFTLNPGSTPKLVPGSTYYLGVQNSGASAVNFAVQVDFHLFTSSPSTNPIPISTITHTNINGTNAYLMVWFAPASDLFQVQWSPGLLQPWTTFTNIIGFHTFISATNSEFEFIDDGSQTGGTLGSGRLYRLILLNTSSGPTILPLTNSVPASNSVAAGAVTYYQVSVPTNADYGTNLLLSGTGPLNIWFSTNNPPTVGGGNDFNLIPSATSGSSTLSSGSTPKLVPGGTYYLGVQNSGASTVNFGVRADFHLATTVVSTNPVPISSISSTNINGTNNFMLVWFAPTNDLFQVQWSTTFPSTWFTFTNIIAFHNFISPTNSEFEFFDDGSQSGGLGGFKYYRLLLYNGVAPSATIIPLTNGVPFNFTTGAGQTNFFSFDITQTNASVLFELYNLTGNGDLNVQRGTLPLSAPYFTNSANTGTNFEQVVLRTNASLVNLNATSWFLGVPNSGGSPISYTIRATVPTNGILVSGLPINTTSTPQGGTNVVINWGPTVIGEKYEIRTNANLVGGVWGALTDIVATSTSMTFTDAIRPSGPLYYRVVQVP